MTINFSSLKAGFLEYLEKLQGTEGYPVTTVKEAEKNIFLYADEFRDYVENELKLGTFDFAQAMEELYAQEDITAILDEVNKEKLLDENGMPIEDENNLETEKENPQEETGDIPLTEDINKEENYEKEVVLGIITELLKNEDFKNLVDIDENGEISKEELEDLIATMKSMDKDGKNLSLEDIIQATEQFNEGTLEILSLEEIENLEQQNVQKENIKQTSTTKPTTQNQNYSNNRKSNYSKNYNPNPTTKPQVPLTLDNMNSAQLKDEVAKRETNLETAQSELSTIQEGTNKELETLKENADNGYNLFIEELEALDSEEAQQLKFILENNKIIDEKNSEIKNNETEIQNQKTAILGFDDELGRISSYKTTLQGKLSELQNAKNNEKNDKIITNINSQISSINSEIANLEKQEKEINENKTKTEEKIKELETKNSTLKEEIATLEESVNLSEEELQILEEKVLEGNAELQTIKEQYEANKLAFENKKEELITNAQNKIAEAQTALKEAKDALTKRLQAEAEWKYTPNGITESVQNAVLAAIHEENLGLVYEAEGANTGECEKFGIGSGENAPWCAGFVSWAFEQGKDNPYQGMLNNKERYYRGSVNSYMQYGIDAGYYSEYNNYRPVPGDVMIQREGNSSHTGIVIGTENNIVYVVEGNTDDDVAIRAYTLGLGSHDKISGWVRTNEMAGGTNNIPGDYFLTDDVKKRLPEYTNDTQRTRTR